MKQIALICLVALVGVAQSCESQTAKPTAAATAAESSCNPGKVLTAVQFADNLKNCPDAQILDVRTPGEFESGHLANAVNINIGGSDFATRVAALDKTKPVFVYCLSGARSASAGGYMRSNGFKTVAEMQGGIMQWRAAQLPLEQGAATAAKPAGMTEESWNKMLATDKLVLVDFYAEWCQPCKKMAPYLEEIKSEMGEKVEVVRIDADKELAIVDKLKVTVLPTLILYKNGKSVWRNEGYVDKKAVVAKLNGAK